MTIARDIAKSIGSSVRSGKIASDGDITGDFNATIYDSTVNLPTTGVLAGAQAYVSSNQRLYIRGTGGWYNIATINNTPTINSVQTAGGDSSPFVLATDGSTTTVITINATDSEGFPITFSAVTDVGFDSMGTVTNDSSVFTITPFSEDSAGEATSGTITFKASDGVNIASEVATFTLTFKIAQSNFTSTHIKASGNNGTNVTINDASSNTHTITVNGNAVAQAFTPHHPGGYSTHFDGTGDYLAFAETADDAFTFGTGDLTVEAWIYPTSAPSVYQTLISTAEPTDYQGIWFGISDTNNLHVIGGNGSSWTLNALSGGAIAVGQWTHVAYVRSGNTHTSYVNGVQADTATNSVSYGNTNNAIVIGGRQDTGSNTQYFPGYISDVRVVKGTAVYTSNFTPPTARLTAISNTKLLACHLPYLADGSSIEHSITVYGNTHTERFGPYDHLLYSASSHGASVYFDGTGDYLTAAHDTTLELQSSNMTLEAWYYPTSTTTGHIVGKRSASGNYGGYQIYWSSSKFGALIDTNTSTPWAVALLTTETFPINTWYHLAFTRNGNNCYLYVNGVQKATTSFTGTANTNASTSFSVGAIGNGDQPLTGFVSDARLVKGTAVYTSAFTPPTSPLTAVTNTQLLTCNDTANVFDASGRTRVSLGSGVKSSTSSTKYASSNIQIDASSGQGQIFPIGKTTFDDITGDVTIEMWVKLDSSAQNYATLFRYYDTANDTDPHIYLRFGNSGFGYHLQFRVNSTGQSNVYSVNLTQSDFTSSFRHVALVRTDGRWRIFVDGTRYNIASGADPSTFSTESLAMSSSLADINEGRFGSESFDGNIEDIRFSPGLSRYPFITPRTTLTSSDQANTKLIACHASTATTDGAGLQTITANGTPLADQAGPHAGMLSVYFDGSNEALRTSDNSSLSMGTGDFTIEAWIKPDNTTTAYRAIVSDNIYGQTSGSWCIYQYGTRLQISANTGSGGSGISTLGASGNTLLSAGVWSHIAFTRASGTARLFHNGVQVGSDTSLSTDFTDDQILIGANNHAGGYPNYDFIGYISNVRVIKGTAIYNKSFTPPAAELKG